MFQDDPPCISVINPFKSSIMICTATKTVTLFCILLKSMEVYQSLNKVDLQCSDYNLFIIKSLHFFKVSFAVHCRTFLSWKKRKKNNKNNIKFFILSIFLKGMLLIQYIHTIYTYNIDNVLLFILFNTRITQKYSHGSCTFLVLKPLYSLHTAHVE